MSIAATDPIIGPSRGTAQGWTTWVNAHRSSVKRPDDVIAYIEAVYALCAADDMPDAFIVVADAFEETGNFSNRWWGERLNAGSLGVTGDAAQNEASPTFKTPEQAARAHVAHLLLYATGTINRGGLKPGDDPRYAAYRDAYGMSVYPTIAGLTGRYAVDPFYAAKIVQRQQEIYPIFTTPVEQPPAGGTPVAEAPLTFGKVPHPAYHDRPISKANGNGMDLLGKRSVIGVTYHRMLGSLNGTDGFFRLPSTAALTDYGMGVAATDGADLDAVVYRWNDPLGYQSGWASGRVIAPWGDGAQFVAKYGANAVNKLRASIEISGNYDTPISNAVKQRIAEISAYWADQAEIPWNVYPIRPEDDFSFVCWHQEFTGPQEKICPGPVVMNATDDIIARTAAIMKRYQEQAVVIPPTPKPEKYAAPITYSWLAPDDGKVHKVGDTRILPLTLTYTTTRSTPRYQKGSKSAEKIGPNIPKGTTFAAHRVFRSGDGVTFVLTRYGSRVLASALLPRVGVTTSGRISVRYDGTGAPDEVIDDNVKESA